MSVFAHFRTHSQDKRSISRTLQTPQGTSSFTSFSRLEEVDDGDKDTSIALSTDSLGMRALQLLASKADEYHDIRTLLSKRDKAVLVCPVSAQEGEIGRDFVEDHVLVFSTTGEATYAISLSGIRGRFDRNQFVILGLLPSEREISQNLSLVASKTRSIFDTFNKFHMADKDTPRVNILANHVELTLGVDPIDVMLVDRAVSRHEILEWLNQKIGHSPLSMRQDITKQDLMQSSNALSERAAILNDAYRFIAARRHEPSITAEKFSQLFQDFCGKIEEHLRGFEAGYLSETQIQESMEWLEQYLCTELYDIMFYNQFSNDHFHDEALQTRIAAMQILNLTLEQLGVKIKSQEDAAFLNALCERYGVDLVRLDEQRDAKSKLALVVNLQKELMEELDNYAKARQKVSNRWFSNDDISVEDGVPHLEPDVSSPSHFSEEPAKLYSAADNFDSTQIPEYPPLPSPTSSEEENGEKDPLEASIRTLESLERIATGRGALHDIQPSTRRDSMDTIHSAISVDVLLPILIYLVIKYNPPKIISNLRFIQRFRRHKGVSGESAYCLTNLLAVVSFLESTTMANLGLSTERSYADVNDLSVPPVQAAQNDHLLPAERGRQPSITLNEEHARATSPNSVISNRLKAVGGVMDSSLRKFGDNISNLRFWEKDKSVKTVAEPEHPSAGEATNTSILSSSNPIHPLVERPMPSKTLQQPPLDEFLNIQLHQLTMEQIPRLLEDYKRYPCVFSAAVAGPWFMTTSLFLDTLRRADLEQYYPSFSTHGITQLQSLAKVNYSDFSLLGVINTEDRKKLFSLIEDLRSDQNDSVRQTPRAAQLTGPTSGLRPPANYQNRNQSTLQTPTKPNAINAASQQVSRGRNPVPGSNQANSPAPRSRSRTIPSPRPLPAKSPMAQAPSSLSLSDLSSVASPLKDRSNKTSNGPSLKKKRSSQLFSVSQPITTDNRRASGPLLDAYGIPIQANNNNNNNTGGRANTRNGSSAAKASGPSDLNQKIRVCVRKRPLSKKELERNEKDIAPAVGTRSLVINEPKAKVDLTRYIEQHSFTFDEVFDSDATNEEVGILPFSMLAFQTTELINGDQIYKRTALPLVKYIFGGGKATCFAYGQTGSGKTYTMLDSQMGLYVLAARDIFAMLRQPENQHLAAFIGFYEIYQGHLYDLLNHRKRLFAREDGKQNVLITGLKEHSIDNVEALMKVFDYGSAVRSTGTTGANSDSSRSHAVLQILLKTRKQPRKIEGKLSFIDLAGSERGADRGEADTKTRMEGAEINKSLLALKECIRALDQDKRHTPFRQSKLTQVLKDSFVGNSRTCMIATISPNNSNSEHTLNTLRYADRVKELKGEGDYRSAESGDESGYGLAISDDYQESAGDMEDEDMMDAEMNYSDPEMYNSDAFLEDEGFPEDQDADILDEDFPNADSYGLAMDADSLSRDHMSTMSRTESKHADVSMTRSHPTASQLPRYQSRDPVDVDANMSLSDLTSRSAATREPLAMQSQSRKSPASPFPFEEKKPRQSWTFDDINDFIKQHRTEIRETTECSKNETKLLANFSLSMSSNQGFGAQPESNEKTTSDFRQYMKSLDDVLLSKMASIELLRMKIKDTLDE
ncbi:hypothetical protein BZG36_01097 [Bifiguratus adelaidae]|uniref:Kinesin motor domain-containing protein n=1 Tax=Bifiguratus adelaidae TaxID=1938954 RepID=A0A261Y5W0_9FUNG|nr:hypothetical protein BZG36_01097 [Bifiguratus adelaidae]